MRAGRSLRHAETAGLQVMKLAIMQPYFFPYMGYWQLLGAVDRFVIYDDVNFIKGGWINRNRILINGKPSYITVPLYHASPNKRICDVSLQPSLLWRKKLIRSIENTYRKAPFFSEVFPVIVKMISYETGNLADFLAHHLMVLATFLKIEAEIVVTSRCYQNNELSGQDRVLDICRREGATTYINLQGGQSLYDCTAFQSENVELNFLVMRAVSYKQRSPGFTPYLSIIDVLMEIGVAGVNKHLNEFDLPGKYAHAEYKQGARNV